MPFVVYSLQRLALFAAALVVLAWLHLGGWLLVVVAAVVAWAVSYLALAGPRDRAALWIAERVERRRMGPRFSPGLTADEVAEDAEAEAITAARQSEGETETEQEPVAELEHPGPGEDGLEQDAPGAQQDGAGQQPDGQRQQQDEH